MNNMASILSENYAITCLILFLLVVNSLQSQGYLHFPAKSVEDSWGYGFKIIDASKHTISKSLVTEYEKLKSSFRLKRSVNDTVDPKKLVTKAVLNDSHTTLIVHWGGDNSDVILALAKNSDQPDSALFLSNDYGKSFTNITDRLTTQRRGPAIHKYYTTKGFINHYVFTDLKNKCIFTTDNSAESFTPHCDIPFVPTTLLLNSLHPKHILGINENDVYKQLYQSDDFGFTWKPIFNNVKSFFWGVQPYDHSMTIYVQEEQANGKSQVVRYRNQSSETLLQDVVNFEVRGEYMFATVSKWLLGSSTNPNIQFWVSYRRQPFVKADFPFTGNVSEYYVADTSEGQLMVCVYHNHSTDLYVSDVQGYKFSLSLRNVVYFNPKTMVNKYWLRLYSNESFADITKVSGVEGIYIASQQASSLLDLEHQVTLISYDKGGQWQRIEAPKYLLGNRLSNCNLNSSCSLHLSQELSRLIPGNLATPILTQDSSPGLIIASGTMGPTLKGEPSVYMSTNAGITWREVLNGNYMYASADHGGVIVAVHQFIPTNELLYSLDEASTWTSYRFINENIRVYGLLTEPGENTTIFSIFGSGLDHHNWMILQVDFANMFNQIKCGDADYYMWSVNDNLPSSDGCLLGRITQYQRRYATALCYNGEDYVRTAEIRNCGCTSEDFECDFGFEEDTLLFQNSLKSELICRQSKSIDSSKINQVPQNCLPGTYYYFSRGYRKVAGDTCEGGQDHRYAPLKYSCPVNEKNAFLLMTKNRAVMMVDLATWDQTNIPLSDSATSPPAIFDFERNCIIYVTVDKAIKTNCLGSNATRNFWDTPLTTSRANDISSMAFEWTGRNIYYTDAISHTIQVVNVDARFQLTLYNSSNKVYKPTQIVLDPTKGYLYYIGTNNTSGRTFCIYQVVMDGSDKYVTALVSSKVFYNSYLTLDLATEQLYWISQQDDQLYSYSLNSQALGVPYGNYLRGIAGLGIFKDSLYVVTSSSIYVRDKHRNEGYSIAQNLYDRVYGVVVVSNTSQHAMSACSSYNKPCTQLCMPMPSANSTQQNRTCLCGDGYRRDTHPKSNDQMCQCEPGEVLQSNGLCMRSSNVTTCASDKVTCRNGHCVMKIWHCDGDDDCGDGTDESDCPYTTCPHGTFTCSKGKCIPERWKCDREDDCRDGHASDELNCNKTCNSHQFRCTNGLCIDIKWVCDLENDCHDNSDETNCSLSHECGVFDFHCANGNCVDSVYRCNREDDCGDNSDEKQCNTTSFCNPEYQFECRDRNSCILKSWVCDGDADCSDKSDEENCTLVSTPKPTSDPHPSECGFIYQKCHNNRCVSFFDICNGVDDCGDNSDEEGCDEEPQPFTSSWAPQGITTCNTLQYQCESRTTQCISKNWVCDGEMDCPGGDDERGCSSVVSCDASEFKCLMDGGCIAAHKRCNQQVDCRDGSDETGCHYNGTVNCSNFRGYKLSCCSNPACGVYISESADCRSVKEAPRYRNINKCDGIVTANYSCKDGQFKCSNGQMSCVSWVQVCDNKKDCDGSNLDELDCDECASLKSSSYEMLVGADNVTFTSLTLSSVSYAEKEDSKAWVNLTWQNGTRRSSPFAVDHLKSATTYIFVLFQQKLDSTKLCPFTNLELTTKDGKPSMPLHVKAFVRTESDGQVIGVNVTWDKPLQPNGQIIEYIVYYQEVDENGKSKSDVHSMTQYNYMSQRLTVYDKIDVKKIYNFWVVARTSAGLGEPSEIIKVIAQSVDLKIEVSNFTDTTVNLTWKGDSEAEGYRIMVPNHNDNVAIEMPAAVIQEIVQDVDKKTHNIMFDHLCPNTSFQFSIAAKYKNIGYGPVWYSKKITLSGQTPAVEISKIQKTGPTKALISFDVKSGAAKVYYVYFTHDKTKTASSVTTTQTSIEIKGLLACENYFVWVRPASPHCPVSLLEKFITSPDKTAAPKHLEVKVEQSSDKDIIILKWNPSCHSQDGNMSYIIHVTEVRAYDLLTPEYTGTDLTFTMMDNILPGQQYNFTVRANVIGSIETEVSSVFVASRDGPYNLVVKFLGGQSVHLSWAWPQSKTLKDFQDFAVYTKGDNVDLVNYTSDFELKLSLPHDGTYLFNVVARGKSGPLAISAQEEFAFVGVEGQATDDVSISKINLVAIIVPVAVVVVALSVGLVVFIVRHKRLQRSFLAFANSHYNIQSGTTTFSDDLDNDEPMINGFSDDEPLVIA